jgi:hypothetical protein
MVKETDGLVSWYLKIKAMLVDAGYGDEIDWQESRNLDDVTAEIFLREGAWVVLNSGMRESVVRQKFIQLAPVFYDWKSPEQIVEHRESCIREAMGIFGHAGKIDAIVEIARVLVEDGFECIIEQLRSQGVQYLQRYPFIGPVTSYHFAKSLGFDVVKPDRHLVRIAEATGFDSPDALCRMIASVTGDKLAVIDLVIWRFAATTPNYLQYLNQEEPEFQLTNSD